MINWFHFLVKGVRIVFRSKEKFGSREKKIVERIKQIQSAKDRSSFEDEGFRVTSGNDDFQNALHALLKKFGRLHGSFRTFKRLLIECCLTYSIANFVHLYFVYGTIAVFSLRAAYDRRNF